MSKVTQELKKQEDLIVATRRKIEAIKEKEAKRILRIADKVGYFNIEISDKALEHAFTKLVESAGSPKENTRNANNQIL